MSAVRSQKKPKKIPPKRTWKDPRVHASVEEHLHGLHVWVEEGTLDCSTFGLLSESRKTSMFCGKGGVCVCV